MTFEELKQITKQPITDDDMFRIRLNIAESKQAEMDNKSIKLSKMKENFNFLG